MKKNSFFLISLILVLCFSPVNGQQNKAVSTIIKLGQTDNQTMNHLDILTNRFGGRLLGSDSFENVVKSNVPTKHAAASLRAFISIL